MIYLYKKGDEGYGKEAESLLERHREIGYKISCYRKHLQMTQEKLAEQLDVSRQHIRLLNSLSSLKDARGC
ncbi:MAG: hypothetical protein NC489_21790 [Ruminococcus flavefaciens]|nr:hypothetical protein [Ruminococcus flavefaciens]